MSKNLSQNPHIENKKTYNCEYCNYITANKKDYGKHETTTKHKRNVTAFVTTVTNVPNALVKTYECILCKESFSYRMALCRHKKQCNIETINKNAAASVEKNDINITFELVKELIKENKELKDLLKEQSTELKDTLKDALKEQSRALIEISTKSNTTLIQNNTTTNNTTNNNSFNLNLFLNEQCKDAISITDFVDSLNLNVGDLEATGKLGYVLGISRIFINKLKELDVYERPLHCTDYKRETVYIKNQDTWEKDNSEKSKLRTIVSRIARKNLEQLPAWQAENPDYVRSDTPENNEYMKISLSSLGGYSNEEENKHVEKIMRNVLKEVTVDKNALTDV
uniref:C2H2-type domain-containing protein n=1 Tax=viral metagenome TaxID=1070528 RepID=A0A6C0L8F0_9ZZZZ